ncbi:MAG: Amuc_1099 family pilus-like system protein [Verrucomicrobiota bacterium]
MNWMKKNYERALLGAFACVLLVCSGWISWQAVSFPENFTGRNSNKKPDNTINPPDVKSVEDAAALASNPRSWTPHEGSLFVSRPYVLRDEKLYDPIDGGVPLHPPITNAWLQKYNLDYGNPNIKDEDPDKDGFTNLEEFLAGTDPTNANSVPPYYTKLRLTKFDPVPFRLKFGGDSGDGETFIINARDTKTRTQFLKLGDQIEGAPYKLLAYEKKTTQKNDLEMNTSELTIQNTETGRKIVLVFDKEADDPTSYGEFLYLWDNSKHRWKKDDELTLPPDDTHKYKLIDISAQEAQIEDLSSGQKIRIGKAE